MATIPLTIRRLGPEDWEPVEVIYRAGIATGNATFETEPPIWEHWDASHLADHRLVAVDGEGTILGWAALSPVSDRCAYRGIAENSVYVAPDAQGRGVGRAVLDRLVTDAEAAGIWTVQTGIFPGNTASLRLHVRWASASWELENASASSQVGGATSCSSSGAAVPSHELLGSPLDG